MPDHNTQLGLYLCEPHGQLIWEGKKRAVAKGRAFDLAGTWILCSGPNAWGVMKLGPREPVEIEDFDSRFGEHRVTLQEREKWWQDSELLFLYPIVEWHPYPAPIPIELESGVQTVMYEVKFLNEASAEAALRGLVFDESRVATLSLDEARAAASDGAPSFPAASADSPAALAAKGVQDKSREEVTMPYSKLSEANPAIRGIKPPVTLAQANLIAEWADEIEEAGSAESPWAVAISQFKKTHRVEGGKWVRKKGSEGEKLVYTADMPEVPVPVPTYGPTSFAEMDSLRSAEERAARVSDLLADFRFIQTNIMSDPRIKDKEAALESAANEFATRVRQRASEASKGDEDWWHEDLSMMGEDVKAKWTRAYVNDLPDSAFLYVEPGGEKDEEGKTVPRTKRHLPYKGKNGKVDITHLRNAISRLGQPKTGAARGEDWLTEELRKRLLKKAQGILAKHGGYERTGGKPRSAKEIAHSIIERMVAEVNAGIERVKALTDAMPGDSLPQVTAVKLFETEEGEPWLLLWTTNAFVDREQEIFATRGIEDYVERHIDDDVKGVFRYRHIPGCDFGDIWWQGVVGRFLVEAGPFRDDYIGRTFKQFFAQYPDGHPTIAPEGWGASHGFVYEAKDREDGVFEFFEKKESSVLAARLASNPWNPSLSLVEVNAMNEQQKKSLLDELRLIGGDKLVDEIVQTGESETKKLEGMVAFKQTEGAETPPETPAEEKPPEAPAEQAGETPPEGETEGAGGGETEEGKTEVPEQVEQIAEAVAKSLQLKQLDEVLVQLTGAVKSVAEGQQRMEERVSQLEQTDELRIAQKDQEQPRFSWFRASQAQETVLSEGDTKLTEAAKKAPEPVDKLTRKLMQS